MVVDSADRQTITEDDFHNEWRSLRMAFVSTASGRFFFGCD